MTKDIEPAQAELLRELFELPTDLQSTDAPREQLAAALEQAREALAGFRMITETTMAGLYLIQDGALQYVNPALVEIFGYQSQDEIVGRTPYHLTHPDDAPKVREYIRRRTAGEVKEAHYTFRGLKADGTEMLCEVVGKVVELRGRPAIVGTLMDVTERERTNAELIESEAYFRGLTEKSPNTILIVRQGRIAFCNRTGSQISGHSLQQLTDPGFSFFDLVAPESVATVRRRFEEHLNGTEGEPYGYKMLTREGRVIEVLQHTRLIQYENELAVLAIITDVTEQNALASERERLLQEAQVRLEQETMLKDAVSLLASTLDVDQVLTSLAQTLCEVADATSVYICSYDPRDRTSSTLAEYYGEEAAEAELESDLNVTYNLESEFPGTAVLLDMGDPIITQIDDPNMGELERQHMEYYGAKSTLLIPLQIAGQITSYAEIWETRAKRTFDDETIERCQAIALQAAIAIENSRLYQQANQEIEERERTQEALRQSEQRYRAVAESASTGIAIADPENRLTYVNPALAELLQYEIEDLDGRLLSDLMPPDQWEIVQSQTELRMRGERSQYELKLQRRDGELRHVLISASPIVDADGNYQAGIGVVTDITELKATQDALSVAIVRMEEALDRTRDMADTEEVLRDTISSLSGSLNLDEVLDRILENVGRVLPHDTVDILLLYGAGDQRELRAVGGSGFARRGTEDWLYGTRLPWQEMHSFRRMEQSGRPLAIPDTEGHPNWTAIPETEWVKSYAGAPLRFRGKTIGFLNLCSERAGAYSQQDAQSLQVFADQAAVAIENARLYAQAQDEITDRKRAERALRSSESRYRNVFEGVDDAIVVEGLDGHILEVNQSACELYGWDREQVLGKSLAELLPEAESLVMQARQDPETIVGHPVEIESVHTGDRTFPLELRFQRHRLEDQDVLLIVGRDVTDRKLVEQAERELAQIKVQFVLSASHSLKTPLHTLMGFLELLSSGKVRDETTRVDFLERASKDAARINDLISDLLDTARVEIGDQGLSLSGVEVQALIEEVMENQSRFAQERQVPVEYSTPAKPLTILADYSRLTLAVEAILNNAIKYSNAGGVVEVSLEATESEIGIRILDHGSGMPEADLRSLFERSLYKTDTTSDPITGTGLGLYLAHNLVKAHGGRIELDSTMGEGSTFTIWLPRAEAQ